MIVPFKDLQVDKVKQPALMNMRYPVENGDLMQNQLRARRRRLMEVLQIEYPEALLIAKQEFANLMATNSKLVSPDDPGRSKYILEQNGFSNEEFVKESIEFFQNCNAILVKEVPMNTLQKTRYSTG